MTEPSTTTYDSVLNYPTVAKPPMASSRLLSLPAELRIIIYELALSDTTRIEFEFEPHNKILKLSHTSAKRIRLGILATNHQIRDECEESVNVFFANHDFLITFAVLVPQVVDYIGYSGALTAFLRRLGSKNARAARSITVVPPHLARASSIVQALFIATNELLPLCKEHQLPLSLALHPGIAMKVDMQDIGGSYEKMIADLPRWENFGFVRVSEIRALLDLWYMLYRDD